MSLDSLLKKSLVVLFFLFFLFFTKIAFASPFIKNGKVLDHGRDPFILREQGLFKMWYTVENGSTLDINYATSVDGITWDNYVENPILLHDQNNIDEKGVSSPSIIHDEQIYKMWYLSTGSMYKISYATSLNGINWQKHGTINLPQQIWESGSHSKPYVIKVGSTYYMWYDTNNNYWSSSLAISPDGLNWTPYNNNPVLYKSEQWESNDTNSLNILWHGSVYEAFYATNNSIAYALSSDGIAWNKSFTQNPVLLPSQGEWDSFTINHPMALKLPNGTTLLYYSGLNDSLTEWSIGLASDGPIDLTDPTPTLTPSPTPSPTLTPTPTVMPTPSLIPSPLPTSTPVPKPVTKVIVIPGFGGSMNYLALASCDTGMTDNWQNWGQAAPLYDPLIKNLSKNGYTVLPFYYDWRKTPLETAAKLDSFISKNIIKGEKVDIVAHSMGGLVARAYIEKHKNNDTIEKLLTVGTPHQGTLPAYVAWTSGALSPWEDPNMIRGTRIIEFFCNKHENDKEILQKVIPSIETLLPTFSYLRRKDGNTLLPYLDMKNKNPWLGNTSHFTSPFYGVNVGTLTGKNKKTPYEYEVTKPSFLEILHGYWTDGKVVRPNWNTEGDSLILQSSGQLDGAINLPALALDHGQLISNSKGIKAILDFLGTKNSLKLSDIEEPNHKTRSVLIVSDNSTFTVTSSDNEKKSTKNNFIVFDDKHEGDYTINFENKNIPGRVLVIDSDDIKLNINEYSFPKNYQSKIHINK